MVGNVPRTGFRLKVRIYDEDPKNHDDRLGNVHMHVPSISPTWAGLKEQHLDIKKRSGSWRAYALRGVAVCVGQRKQLDGELVVSVECLGRTEVEGGEGRLFTLAPCE